MGRGQECWVCRSVEAGCLVMAARERVGKVDPGLTCPFLLIIIGWAWVMVGLEYWWAWILDLERIGFGLSVIQKVRLVCMLTRTKIVIL